MVWPYGTETDKCAILRGVKRILVEGDARIVVDLKDHGFRQ